MTDPRPKLSWSDLAGARVGIWGLGREGHASLRKLLALGVEPVLVDDRPAGPAGWPPVLATGDGGLAALQRCDVVVKTPGISRYRPEVARLSGRGIPVVGGLGLWLAEADLRRVLCVTGTKGKSTTSSVTGHLLAGLGLPVPGRRQHRGRAVRSRRGRRLRLLGHRGVQLPGHRPAVLAARGRGHLAAPRPPRLARRSRAVLPGQAVRVLPAGSRPDRRQRRQRPAPRARRAARPAGRVGRRSTTIPARPGWSRSACPAGTTAATRSSPAAACSPSASRARTTTTALRAAAAGYQPLPSRLTPIGTVGGVTFVDDSLSTNVLPTLAALDAFPGRRIALIVGGHDRGIDYAPLAAGVWPAAKRPPAC